MTRGGTPWPVRLTEAAEADFRDIIRWTAEQFGDTQATAYGETITAALLALTEGPDTAGVTARADVLAGLKTLHVARGGRRGRHFVMFRVTDSEGADVVDVLRILHDAMDPSRHV